tara:strand:+ start:35778 stop:37064 length:1287 start_codon:yes stop_codon:yes gene_type:complete
MPTPFKPTNIHSNYPHLEGDSSFSFSDIKNQFSDTGSVSLSEFYKSGSLVSESDGNLIINSGISSSTSVPSSGKISLTDLMIKPYFDVVYAVASSTQTVTSDYTYTLPQNCGFTHMKIFIQGAGASGHIGPWAWSGRGGITASSITAPAGGNGGDYAQSHSVPVTSGDVITIKVGNGGKALGGSAHDSKWGFQGVSGNAADGGTSYVYKNGNNILTVAGASKSTNHIRTSTYDSGTKSVETHGYTLSGYASGPGTGNKVTIYDNSKLELHYAGGWGGTSYLSACLVSNASTLTASPTFNYNSSRYGGGGAPGYQTADSPSTEGISHDIRGVGFGWRVAQTDWISEVTATHGGVIGSKGKGFNNLFTRQSTGSGYGFGGTGSKGSNSQTEATSSNQGGPGFVRIMFFDANATRYTSGITYNRTKARFAG